MLSRISGFGGF